MKPLRLSAVPALLAIVAGCSATAPGEQERASEAPSQCEGKGERPVLSTDEPEPNTGRALVGAALADVCLDDTQRSALEAVGDRVRASEAGVSEKRLALRTAVLDGLKSGQMDDNAVAGAIDAWASAREEASPVLRKGLEDLHVMLDDGQRAALSDGMISLMDDMTKSSAGWLDTLATDLALSAEQKQSIGDLVRDAKPKLDEERALAQLTADRFKTRDFDMESVSPIATLGQAARERAGSMVQVAKALASILTDTQRADLVNKIEGAVASSPVAPPEAASGGSAEVAPSSLGATRIALVVARGYRAGRVRGWGGGTVVVGSVQPATTVVVVPTSGYVVGYPVTPGYGPGVW